MQNKVHIIFNLYPVRIPCSNVSDPHSSRQINTNLPATVRIPNVRTWHPDRTLSYLLKIMCTLFQNREQNSVGCHSQFVHPTFVWRFPLNHYLINYIPNCLGHHVGPRLGHCMHVNVRTTPCNNSRINVP